MPGEVVGAKAVGMREPGAPHHGGIRALPIPGTAETRAKNGCGAARTAVRGTGSHLQNTETEKSPPQESTSQTT